MDDPIPGSFDTSSNLGTPIKKIKGLNLNSSSPLNSSPLYPNLDEIEPRIEPHMKLKGYSQRLTNNVLRELNVRANEISQLLKTSPKAQIHNESKRKFNGIHRSRFNKMDSISSHYSIHRRPKEISPTRVVAITENETPSTSNDSGKRNPSINLSSASKRRRTLNGPEEVLNNSSPLKHTGYPLKSSPLKVNSLKISPSKASVNLHATVSSASNLNNRPQETFNYVKQKTEMNPPQLHGLNGSKMNASRKSPSKISPSKGSMNLHEILQGNVQEKPKASTKSLSKRASSLELAGVKQPVVRKHVPTDTSEKGSRLNSNSSLRSIPNLQASSFKCHDSNLKKSQSNIDKLHNLRTKTPSTPQLPKSTSSNSWKLPEMGHNAKPSLTAKNYTIPQAPSFYAKPTISSSQKSLNRFHKFKDRFQ